MHALLVSNLLRGKEEGLFRSELNPQFIASLYTARMEMLEHTELLNDSEKKSADFIREIFIYHLHGICNSNGLRYLEANKKNLKKDIS